MKHYLVAILAVLMAPTVFGAQAEDPFGAQEGINPTPCGSVQEGSLTVAEVVDIALCSNPQTREVWANSRYQAAQVGIARSAYLPTISAALATSRDRYSGISTTREQSAGLALSWLLFDLGGRDSTLESARQLLTAVSASRDSTVQLVSQSAVQAYYQVRAAEAALAAARLSETAYQESYKAAEARYRVGSATPVDKLQAQTANSQSRLIRIQAEGALRTAQGNLATIMGRDAHRPVMLASQLETAPETGFEQDVETLIASARERRPDLVAAEARVRAAEADVLAARSAGMPTVGLGVTTGKSRTDSLPWDSSSSIGVTVSIPIFSGYSSSYKIKAAEAQVDARLASRERLRLQVAQDVWNAYQSLVTANQSLRSTADLLVSAELSERVTRGRYESGVGSILDLLNAQSALATARQQRVQAMFDWNVSRTTLAFAMGNLDMDMLNRLTGIKNGSNKSVTQP